MSIATLTKGNLYKNGNFDSISLSKNHRYYEFAETSISKSYPEVDFQIHEFKLEEFINEDVFAKISHIHFVLYAKHLNYNQLPLVITNVGEPIYINDNQLTEQDSRILQHGDVIGLDKDSVEKLFTVTYCNPRNLNISEEAKTQIFKKYFIGDLIGSGGFGAVHVCHMLTPENDEKGRNVFKTYALKTVKIIDHKAMREVEIMEALQNVEKLRNVHIMELIDYQINKDVLFMTLPLMTGGTLKQLIETNQRLSENESRYYFHQLMKGLNFLHGKGYTHRDIKSDNLLLTEGKPKILKISDFGLAKFLERNNNTICGTPVYAAPEILKRENNYDNKVDDWSCGVVLYEMLSGKLPFREIQILSGNFDYDLPDDFSEDAKNIIRSMICVDPEARWSAQRLLTHCWLMSEMEEVETYCTFTLDEIINVQKKKNPFWKEPGFVIPIAAGGLVLGGLIGIYLLSEKKTKQ